MSTSWNPQPGSHQSESRGWSRNNGIVTFGTSFSNYEHTSQDQVLVMPLGMNYPPINDLNNQGFFSALCPDCLATIDPEHSVGSFERFPCVVTFRPCSRIRIGAGNTY